MMLVYWFSIGIWESYKTWLMTLIPQDFGFGELCCSIVLTMITTHNYDCLTYPENVPTRTSASQSIWPLLTTIWLETFKSTHPIPSNLASQKRFVVAHHFEGAVRLTNFSTFAMLGTCTGKSRGVHERTYQTTKQPWKNDFLTLTSTSFTVHPTKRRSVHHWRRYSVYHSETLELFIYIDNLDWVRWVFP